VENGFLVIPPEAKEKTVGGRGGWGLDPTTNTGRAGAENGRLRQGKAAKEIHSKAEGFETCGIKWKTPRRNPLSLTTKGKQLSPENRVFCGLPSAKKGTSEM